VCTCFVKRLKNFGRKWQERHISVPLSLTHAVYRINSATIRQVEVYKIKTFWRIKQNRQVSLPTTEFAVELFLFVASGALGVSARYFFNCFTFDATNGCLRVART